MPATSRTHAQRQLDAEDRLTQALAELIAEQGFERTTAAEIGERAGYSRAAVRDRYGSKEGLLDALHARYERMLLGGGGSPAPATIDEFFERLAAFAREHPEWLRAIFVVSFESVGASTAFAPVVRRWVSTLDALGIALLEAEQAAGTVPADLDAAALAPRLRDEAVGGAFRWTLEQPDADYGAYLERWTAQVRAQFG